jgi:fumarate reductase flavoprotein subunit
MMQGLEANLVKRGGSVVRGTRATGLDVSGAPVVRVHATQRGAPVAFDADAVVLADGGFPADPSLIREHISPVPEKLQQRNARTSRGDALRMAQAVGGATVGMDCFYGHLLSRDAMTNDALWPRPYVDALAVAGIASDRTGGASRTRAKAACLSPTPSRDSPTRSPRRWCSTTPCGWTRGRAR